jgi:hypothetical protein
MKPEQAAIQVCGERDQRIATPDMSHFVCKHGAEFLV